MPAIVSLCSNNGLSLRLQVIVIIQVLHHMLSGTLPDVWAVQTPMLDTLVLDYTMLTGTAIALSFGFERSAATSGCICRS